MTEIISLYTWCKENKKEWLVEQWDYKKNYPLTPKDISFGSTKAVAWIYEYVDDKSVFTFQWTNSPNRRTIAATRSDNVCPFINGNVLYRGFNDLQTRNPSLAKLWHPKKNGNLKPCDVMAGSGKKVWWQQVYEDPATKKKFVFEWQDSIKAMNKDMSNPYISNHLVYKGFNDLETWCKLNKRKDIIVDWDYEKNNMNPKEIVYGSSKRIAWKCHICEHKWITKLVERTRHNTNCPKCSKWHRTSFPEQALLYYFEKTGTEVINSYKPYWLLPQEIDLFLPSFNVGIEYDGSQFHKDVKRDELKAKICCENGIKLIRIRESKCPELNSEYCRVLKLRNNDRKELEKAIISLFKIINMKPPEISIDKDSVEIMNTYYFDRKDKSIENQYPHLCQEWHPTFNGNLKPAMFSPSSSRRVWRKCLKCGHEWEATISNRTTGGSQCPVCSAKTRGQKQNKVIMCRETGKVFIGTKEVAEEFGVSKQYVSSCCRTHKPLLKKYHLIYINDIHDYHKRIAAQKSSSLFDKD